MSLFYTLKVKSILRQTDKAVQLVFDVPEDLKSIFNYEAGQYITLSTSIDKEEVRRSYSICSAKNEDLSVVVKAIQGGVFSNFVNTSLNEGDALKVMPPEGHFKIDTLTENSNYCAFVAGSGITPVMSMIKTVLSANSTSKFVLVYGNKTYPETIFYNELKALKTKYNDRLFIEYICSQAQEEEARFGRIDKPIVNFITKNKYKEIAFTEYFLCGPEPMIELVKSVLLENGITESNIKYELFYSSKDAKDVEAIDGVTKLTVIVDDETHELQMKSEDVVLDVILKEDIDVPYSCQGGICSSCLAQIKKGKAVMQKNQILTEDEVEQGLILTCQAVPQSPELEVDYDDI